MTAPTKAFVNILDTAVDPDSPVDTYLMTGLRDNDLHLKEVLYGSYTATQNHNHDGVNSALVEIGPNLLRNGSFEQDTDGWIVTEYTGGSHAINTAQAMDGAKCLAITSTSTANGGGEAVSGEYIPIAGNEGFDLKFAIKASVANVSAKIDAIWYDAAKAQISVSTLYTTTNTPTAPNGLVRATAAPANARFLRSRLIGGVPGSGSAAGTVYFDGVQLSRCDWAEPGDYDVGSPVGGQTSATSMTKKGEIVAPKSGVYRCYLSITTENLESAARIYRNGVAYGTYRQTAGSPGSSVKVTEDLYFSKGELVQAYAMSVYGYIATVSLQLREAYPNGHNARNF